MSFGNTSAVHSHLSTKHSLFPRLMVQNAKDENLVEPLHDEGRFAERAPPQEVEDPKILPFHE